MFYFDVPKNPQDILDKLRLISHNLFLVTDEKDYQDFINSWVKDNPVHIWRKDKFIITYHNWCHMGHVTILAQQYALHIGMSLKERVILYYATMFHDYSHSFGLKPDVDNITVACESFLNAIKNNKFCKRYYDNLNLFLQSEFVYNVIKAIQVSEYPFIHTETNDIQRIMRDIDLTMCLSPMIDIFPVGLSNETNQPITIKDMLQFSSNTKINFSDIADCIKQESLLYGL